jgi:hypothetical protein
LESAKTKVLHLLSVIHCKHINAILLGLVPMICQALFQRIAAEKKSAGDGGVEFQAIN